MQFKPELVAKILAGKKTMTSRPKKSGDLAYPDSSYQQIGCVRDGKGRLRWRVGDTYAIQPGRGEKGIARFRLLHIASVDVRDFVQLEAVAEGFQDRVEFWQIWCRFYDPLWKGLDENSIDLFMWLRDRPHHLYDAWALTFELVENGAQKGDYRRHHKRTDIHGRPHGTKDITPTDGT
jgi:hypothetical protein